MGNNVGYWDSCSGCTEGEDGYINERYYPIHPKHGVHVGGGCDECKGKGIVFHRFTKADAKAWEEYASTASKAEGAYVAKRYPIADRRSKQRRTVSKADQNGEG